MLYIFRQNSAVRKINKWNIECPADVYRAVIAFFTAVIS